MDSSHRMRDARNLALLGAAAAAAAAVLPLWFVRGRVGSVRRSVSTPLCVCLDRDTHVRARLRTPLPARRRLLAGPLREGGEDEALGVELEGGELHRLDEARGVRHVGAALHLREALQPHLHDGLGG